MQPLQFIDFIGTAPRSGEDEAVETVRIVRIVMERSRKKMKIGWRLDDIPFLTLHHGFPLFSYSLISRSLNLRWLCVPLGWFRPRFDTMASSRAWGIRWIPQLRSMYQRCYRKNMKKHQGYPRISCLCMMILIYKWLNMYLIFYHDDACVAVVDANN